MPEQEYERLIGTVEASARLWFALLISALAGLTIAPPRRCRLGESNTQPGEDAAVGAAFLTGFALFTVAGFVLGALYGIAWGFWSKRLG